MELERYLEGLPVPILLLDDDASVLFANGRAREILGKELPETRRRRIGEVFECVWALSPRGCGRTEHCSGCAIRRSVTETHRTGLPLSGVRARLCRTSPEGEERTWLRISTSLAGDVVLLRVEGLDQLPEEGSRD
jgi:PAS domain-containing protein